MAPDYAADLEGEGDAMRGLCAMSDIRKLAMRLATESRFMAPSALNGIMMCGPDELERLIRAAIREGMSRAANTCTQVHYQRADAGRKTGYNAIIDIIDFEEVIRAEADKMEVK